MTHHLVVKVLHAGAVQGTRRAPDHRSAVGVLCCGPAIRNPKALLVLPRALEIGFGRTRRSARAS